MSIYLDIFIGDHEEHARLQAAYDATRVLLTKHAVIYGLAINSGRALEEQREIVTDLDKSTSPPLFQPPAPLHAGRLVFELSPSAGLAKTTANFTALCTGERGACKQAPNRRLHYEGCAVHRIVKGFVAQGGDVTRGDGSGGESIYGAKFNDEKEGLKAPITRGALAMANSGKNSNTSQFFVVLAREDTPEGAAQIKKMAGKYVVFGRLKEGWDVLDKLDAVGTKDGNPMKDVRIGGCGKC